MKFIPTLLIALLLIISASAFRFKAKTGNAYNDCLLAAGGTIVSATLYDQIHCKQEHLEAFQEIHGPGSR